MTATTVKIPELTELTFEEGPHIYRLNGVEIPSVSELMKPLKDTCYAGVGAKTLENAANKGTSVHNSIENWIKFAVASSLRLTRRPSPHMALRWGRSTSCT